MAVNLSPIWGAGAQLLDNSGNVLSGGKIYTYAAGTTTPAATYTSSNGLTANSNPIILNSAGRVPYEIWLTDGISYKFVLKDSNDVLIATYDNLTGINSNFIAYTAQQEIQTATAGQTVFNLTTMQYQPGTNNLSVFVDGVNQYGPGAQYAYVETDSDTVTFVSGLHVGASVKFTTATPVSSSSTDAQNVSFTGVKGQTGNVADLGTMDGSDWVGFQPDGTGAVSADYSIQDKLRQTVSVKDFGAVGDGVTDDTAAIKAAINSAVASGWNQPKSIYFPAGNYVITETNVFGQWDSIDTSTYRGVRGLKFYGDSKYSSLITLQNTTSSDMFIYDNYSGSGTTATNNSLLSPKFEDLGFVGDAQSTGKVYGFRPYGTPNGYPSQNWEFISCRFYRLYYAIWLSGTTNTSENSWIDCGCQECWKFIYSDNDQAVNQEVINTNVENYFAAAFDFIKGGQLTVIGGSYIANATTINDGIAGNNVVLNLAATSSGLTTNYKFTGIKTEMHAPDSRLVSLTGLNNASVVTFSDCSFLTRTGAAASTAIIVGAASKTQLKFDNCIFSGSDNLTWENNGSSNYWITAPSGNYSAFSTVEFNNCQGINTSNVTWQANTLGFTKFYGNGSTPVEIGNFGVFTGNAPSTLGLTYKVVQGYGTYWPQGGGSPIPYISATVPIGSTIKSILVRKGGIGGSTSSYQLQIQDGSGTAISVPAWASGSNSSTIAAQNQEHYIYVTNLMKYVSNSTDAVVRVAVTAGNEGGSTFQTFHTATENDLFLIEYI